MRFRPSGTKPGGTCLSTYLRVRFVFWLVALSPLASRCAYVAGFIAYGAFEATYLFAGTKVLLLGSGLFAQGPLCSLWVHDLQAGISLLHVRGTLVLRVFLFTSCPCPRFLPLIALLGWLLLASNEVITIVLFFPALFCSVLLGVVSIGLQ